MKNKKKKTQKNSILFVILALCIGGITYYKDDISALLKDEEKFIKEEIKQDNYVKDQINSYDMGEIPEFNGEPYIYINNNKPNFDEKYYVTTSFETYSQLDYLERCGVAFANIGIDLMPTEERGSIGSVKPSGWHTVKYDIVDGKYLYNRCHLIGYQLTAENANKQNLITCTRYMNTTGMLKWENEVAKYVKETNNHVLYRVTPIFEDDNLLATGVQIEASSVEDNCKDVCFNVFIYNVQNGIEIDYKTGDSKLKE